MNVIDFIAQSAKYMAEDRADVYESEEDAIAELTLALDTLRQSESSQSMCIFSSYILMRFLEDGAEEVFLTKKLSSLVLFEEEEIFRAYGWVDGIQLDDPEDDGLDY